MTQQPNIIKFAIELKKLENSPLMQVELPPLAAVAIISHIQLAVRHPEIFGKEDGLTPVAIDIAKQLQRLLNPDSEIYRVLELGWNPELERAIEPEVSKPKPRIEKPVTVRMSMELACSLIQCVQFTAKHAVDDGDDERIRIAVAFALDLQKHFDPNSEIYKSLESGWEEEETDTASPEIFEQAVKKACDKMGIKFVKLE